MAFRRAQVNVSWRVDLVLLPVHILGILVLSKFHGDIRHPILSLLRLKVTVLVESSLKIIHIIYRLVNISALAGLRHIHRG